MSAALDISEQLWQQQVIDLAHVYGWRHNHTRRSIGKGRKWTTATSCAGYPDLTLWSESQQRLIFAELKSETGKLSPEQTDVIGSLRRAGQAVFVWHPSDLDAVVEELRPR